MLSSSSTVGIVGREHPDPPDRERRERHHRDRRLFGARGRRETVPAQHRHQLLLDQSRVPGRVLRLDQQAHLPVAVHHEFQQPFEREHLADGRVPVRVEVDVPLDEQLVRAGRQVVLPGAEVERVQVGQRAFAHQTASVGGAVQPAVVDADQMTVSGQPDVTLERVGAVANCLLVGRQRVFGDLRGGASVGNDHRSIGAHTNTVTARRPTGTPDVHSAGVSCRDAAVEPGPISGRDGAARRRTCPIHPAGTGTTRRRAPPVAAHSRTRRSRSVVLDLGGATTTQPGTPDRKPDCVVDREGSGGGRGERKPSHNPGADLGDLLLPEH